MRILELRETRLNNPGWTLQQLGTSFGVTRQAVHDMLKRWEGRPLDGLKPMLDIEAAYVGALIDTDGCVTYVGGRYWHILFTNTEVELVSNALRLTGTGRISYRHRGGHYKDIWKWGVYRGGDVAALMKRLKPYSLKVQRALDKIDTTTP